MKICFIVEGYPTAKDPFFSFIREIVIELAKRGNACTVIAPQSVTRAVLHKIPLRPLIWKEEKSNEYTITIMQPKYFAFPGKLRLSKYNKVYFERAVKSAFKKLGKSYDVLYAHFWHMGMIASRLECDIPVIVACGESKISVQSHYSHEQILQMLSKIKGAIYVSTKSYNESKALGLQIDNIKYLIAPNGFNPEIFKITDKMKMRSKLKISADEFVISFVGAFNERKGSKRLQCALNRLRARYSDISAIYIGKGPDEPEGEGIVFKGTVAHDKIVDYLCASDVFVLPTTNEGCCNAIVEAIACGVPVISSKESFNDDILNSQNSIRVDSMSIDEIAYAIEQLYLDRSLCERLHQGAMMKAQELSIVQRAERIEQFIKGIKDET